MPDLYYPRIGEVLQPFATTPSFAGFGLDQSADALEYIFHTADDITITRLGLRVQAITGTTPTYRVSLQGVDLSSGFPDGIIKGGTNNALKTFSPSGLGWSATEWHWLTLDESYACSAGEYLAMVIDYSSGTIDGSNFASFSSALGAGFTRFPYIVMNNNGSRSKSSSWGVYGYGSASRAYGRPMEAINTHNFSSSSTPDEYALKFSLPAGSIETYRVAGARFYGSIGQDFSLRLYSGTNTIPGNSTGAVGEGTVQQSVDLDASVIGAATGPFDYFFDETTLATLYGGGVYRISLLPATTSNIALYSLDTDAAADWDAWPLGQNFSTSTRVDAGDWTDAPTRRVLIEPILADINAGRGHRATFILGM